MRTMIFGLALLFVTACVGGDTSVEDQPTDAVTTESTEVTEGVEDTGVTEGATELNTPVDSTDVVAH